MIVTRYSLLIAMYISIGHGFVHAQWNCINSYDTMGFRDVHFINNDVGFVVGYKIDNQNSYFPGVILRTLDGGTNWDTTFSNNYDGLWCVSFPDSMTGYAGGSGGAILKTSDGGDTWSYLAQPFGNVPWLTCFFTSPDTGYFSCTSVGPHIAIMTTDGGQTWAQVVDTAGNAIGGHAIHFPSQDTGFIITSGLIYRTIDGGGSWFQESNMFPSTCGARDVYFIDAMKGYAVGNGVGGQWGNYGSVATTIDGGQTWSSQSFFNIFSFHALTFAPDGRGYTGGQGNSYDDLQMLSTIDGGATWKPQQVSHGSIIPLFLGISAPSDSVAYAVSANGLIYKTTNSGGPLLSISGMQTQEAVHVYPNPGSDVITFQFSDSQQSRTVIVYNALGKEVWREETGASSLMISVQGFSEGIYFYSVAHEDGAPVKGKFVVR